MSALVVVGKSTVANAGQGLFACAKLAAGETVAEYTGKRLNLEQSKSVRNRSYLKCVSLNLHIDAAESDSPARYVNDHADPARWNVRFESRDHRVFVVATREVEAGEELFGSYGRGHWVFNGCAAFLNLAKDENGVVTTKEMAENETVMCLTSPALNDVEELGKRVRFAESENATEVNCMLKSTPFVRNTTMVCAVRDIAVGEHIVVRSEDRVQVRMSSIAGAGMGIFARVEIPAKSCIGSYRGTILDESELKERLAMFPSVRFYALRISPGSSKFIDPTDKKGLCRPFVAPHVAFVNDGSLEGRVNSEFYIEDGEVKLRTTNQVGKEEEILVDYRCHLDRNMI